MWFINRALTFGLRSVRGRGQRAEAVQPQSYQKIKLTEEQITQMGQYKMRPRSRNVKDIFKDRAEQKMHEDFLRKQKQDVLSQKADQFQDPKQKKPKMQKKTKQQKAQQLRTFKIYKHVDLVASLRERKKKAAMSKDLITEEVQLFEMSKVRLIEQYLPFEYMKNCQKIFHKYDQTTLRNIAFHFTNLMKLRYSQEKINYDEHPGLEFQKLEEKLPYHRKVEQIYLTSKEKALEIKEETRKVDQDPDDTDIKYTQNIIISYLLNRVPRTYAVAFRTLHEIKKMFNTYKPTTFLDFGSGLSSGSAAFIEHFGNTGSVYNVEPAGKMRKLSKFLTSHYNIVHFESLAQLSSQVKQVDIVYCGYVLNQLKSQLVTVYLEALLAKVVPGGFLILTEYGNPFGARLIHESRRWALTKKIRIAAPCPHHMKCPLSSSKHWCHFDQPSGMLPRQVFGKLPSENAIKMEKYSYLILQKLEEEQAEEGPQVPEPIAEPNRSREWDRILFPLMRKGKHFIYTICTQNGKFEKRIAAKSHGFMYKEGRKLKWGDFWRHGFRIPNRFRKERRTGKRLW